MSYVLTASDVGITLAANVQNGQKALLFPGGVDLSGTVLLSGASPRVLACACSIALDDDIGICGDNGDSSHLDFLLKRSSGSAWGLQTFGADIASATPVFTSNWQILVGTYDGSNTGFLKIIDTSGTAASATAALGTLSTTGPFYVGGQAAGFQVPLGSYIGDVIALNAIPGGSVGSAAFTTFLSKLHDRWFGTDALAAYLNTIGSTVVAWLDPNRGVAVNGADVTTWTSRAVASGNRMNTLLRP